MKELQTRLEVLRDMLMEKVSVGKKILKEDYDRKAKLRKFNPCQESWKIHGMVLTRYRSA